MNTSDRVSPLFTKGGFTPLENIYSFIKHTITRVCQYPKVNFLTGRVGFTVVELIMIIVIISILAAMAIPKFTDAYADIKLNGCARRIINDIRHLQQLAISTRYLHWVVFDKTNNLYRLYGEDPVNQGKANRILITVGDATVELDDIADGVTISSVNLGGLNKNEIEFDELGIPSDINGNELNAPGSITITYQGEDRTVEVAERTGRVYMVP